MRKTATTISLLILAALAVSTLVFVTVNHSGVQRKSLRGNDSGTVGNGNNGRPVTTRTPFFSFRDSKTGVAILPDQVEVKSQTSGQTVLALNRQDLSAKGLDPISLEPGQYEMSVSAAGYLPISTNFSVTDEPPLATRVFLDPINPPREVQSAYINSLRRDGFLALLGFVTDDQTGQPLSGVTASSDLGSDNAVTDNRGYFLLYIPERLSNSGTLMTAIVFFAKPGYVTQERRGFGVWSRGALVATISIRRGIGVEVIHEYKRR